MAEIWRRYGGDIAEIWRRYSGELRAKAPTNIHDARELVIPVPPGTFVRTKGGKVLGDTWVFDPVTLRWAQRVPSPNERTPPARFSHRAVAVSVHRFVVFGGYGVGSNNATRLIGDVWALDISEESSEGWL